MKDYVWMLIDLENNEEPLAVADTQYELAKICKVKPETIRQAISRAKRMKIRCRYVKVYIGD